MTYFTAEIERTKGIRKFFKGEKPFNNIKSYFQFKGTLFRTETIDYSTENIPLLLEELKLLIDNFKILYGSDETMLKLLNIKKLEKEVKKIEASISQIQEPERKLKVEYTLVSKLLPIKTFRKVKVRFASDICMFWCPFCKDLFFEIDIDIDTRYNYPRCPNCGKILQQTPIWVLKKDTHQKRVITPLTVWINKYKLQYLWDCWTTSQYVECLECENGLLKKYYSTDPARIYESSKLQCDECGKEYNIWAFGKYSLTSPTENITIPFVVSVFNKSSIYYDAINLKNIIEDTSVRPPFFETKYVDEFLFSPRVIVKELVVGFWHGVHAKRLIPSEKTGLELCTSGIYIKINNSYFKESLNFLKEVHQENPEKIKKLEKISPHDPTLKRTILHSLAHSVLSKLPIYSGISIDNFGYIYDINTNSVLIYERCEGGLGACYILTQIDEEKGTGEYILHDFINEIKESIKNCNCDNSCKYCLALVGCQEFNSHLDRFSLGPLFNLKPVDLTWGF